VYQSWGISVLNDLIRVTVICITLGIHNFFVLGKIKIFSKARLVDHTYNPNTGEAEAGGPSVQDTVTYNGKTLSPCLPPSQNQNLLY
jgi:hypothetical protein